jgi:hypothetical protein
MLVKRLSKEMFLQIYMHANFITDHKFLLCKQGAAGSMLVRGSEISP